MATVHRRDPRTGEWTVIDISLSPGGAPGPTGPTGPTRVSIAPGNAATIDPSGIYVPVIETQAATDLLYVNTTGDTMSGRFTSPTLFTPRHRFPPQQRRWGTSMN